MFVAQQRVDESFGFPLAFFFGLGKGILAFRLMLIDLKGFLSFTAALKEMNFPSVLGGAVAGAAFR